MERHVDHVVKEGCSDVTETLKTSYIILVHARSFVLAIPLSGSLFCSFIASERIVLATPYVITLCIVFF